MDRRTQKIKKYFYVIIISICYLQENVQKDLTLYNYEANDIGGNVISLKKYKGKKMLIVNVASQCGFTPQYEGLQKLHEIYGDSLAVLGFPSNDFFWQEPGSNSQIKNFCKLNYGVTFQMFEKIHVKGKKQHPLYRWLSNSKLNGWNDNAPTWNFCKYLIDENGKLLEFYRERTEPTDTIITRHFRNRLMITTKKN